MVVTLHRGHTYTGVEGVREEVGGRAVELVQGGVSQGKQVRRGGGGVIEKRGEEGRRGREGEASHILRTFLTTLHTLTPSHPHFLTPSLLHPLTQHPVLTLGDDLGSRVVLYEGHSPVSGGYVVEECEGGGGEMVRRLIFTSTPHLAQTEVRMVQGGRV